MSSPSQFELPVPDGRNAAHNFQGTGGRGRIKIQKIVAAACPVAATIQELVMRLLQSLLVRRLKKEIRTGHLKVTFPGGDEMKFGEGVGAGVSVRIVSWSWLRRLVLDPEIQFGEAYMNGGLVVQTGSLYDLLDLIWKNVLTDRKRKTGIPTYVRKLLKVLAQFNTRGRSVRNVAHHYDVGNELYRLFLDEDMQYSCAYYAQPDISLKEAQRQKKDHIARKLCLEPGNDVLDIGCGWGGLALHLAEAEDVRVHGITLSSEQLNLANSRACFSSTPENVKFERRDYRNLDQTYDRIVSVGMFEHVGTPHYHTFFRQISEHLKPDGVALIHTIGRTDGPGATDPWIARHIFPGGYIPALSEILPAIEDAGLMITDLEVLRLHYAETLRAWRQKFHDNIDEIEALYDERFLRMWEFYLVSSELSFRYGVHVVFQIQLARQQGSVPLTRDYLYASQEAASRDMPVPEIEDAAMHQLPAE